MKTKEKAIKHFKALLPCDKFIVTGSYALQLLGVKDKSSDLDIILLNPTDECINILTRLSEVEGNKSFIEQNDSYPSGKLIAQMDFEGLKVDFFKESDKVKTLKLKDYYISTIDHIINCKKSYGRLKDFLQLRTMAKKFYTEEEFQAFLNNQPQ